jgi:signal peptidase I
MINKMKITNIIEWIICIIIAVILALAIRYYIITPTVVKKSSMYPTLMENQRLLLSRIIRTTKEIPNRGDIITFEKPSKISYTADEIDKENPIAKYEYIPSNFIKKFSYYILEIGKESYIKRVIALPGEHVVIKDGKVFINNKELDEKYLQEDVKTEINQNIGFDDFIVPQNCIFAMGDNRSGSMDCRDFGCIPLKKIEGTVWIRIFPFNKFGKI